MVGRSKADETHGGLFAGTRTPDQILGPYFPISHAPAAQADLTSINGADGRA
jgi:hypothetical protein